MGHAHDKTLLASLGFSDPDRSDQRHDLACRYIASAEVAQIVASFACPKWVMRVDVGRALTEVPISKGHNQYKTTIGFIDVFMHIVAHSKSEDGCEHESRECVAVEVKTNRLSFGQILRQVKLYQEYRVDEIWSPLWVVACDFEYDMEEASVLQAHGIKCLRLGEKFQRWCEERRNNPVRFLAPEV